MSTHTVALADLDADRERILAVWRAGLTHGGMPEAKIDWYYGRNPEGRPQVLFLLAPGTGEPVGVASLIPRRMRYGAQTFSAGALADLVVAPEHRSFFPAFALQKALRRLGLEAHDIVYGLPNPLSEPVVRRAGYHRIGESVRSSRVLRSASYFARFMPAALAATLGAAVDRTRMAQIALRIRTGGRFEAEWLDRPDARFDDLWERAAPPRALAGARDARFLDWRFAQSPFGRYEFLALGRGDTRELCAYAAFQVREHALYVYDFLADPGIAGADTRLWLELARDAWRRGLASATVEFLGDRKVRAGMKGAGWLARDRRVLYATFDGCDELRDESAWYLTRADEDT